MRVIDQYGGSDIPYENACIMIDEGNIVAYMPAAAGNNLRVLMAEYSTIEAAKEAMEWLHDDYKQGYKIYRFSLEEDA